jgi:hypothetical protein
MDFQKNVRYVFSYDRFTWHPWTRNLPTCSHCLAVNWALMLQEARAPFNPFKKVRGYNLIIYCWSKGYLRQMSILNQAMSLSLQLRDDIHLTNHKYIAHQIALLYVSPWIIVYDHSENSIYDSYNLLWHLISSSYWCILNIYFMTFMMDTPIFPMHSIAK